jgi:hypothetical protein
MFVPNPHEFWLVSALGQSICPFVRTSQPNTPHSLDSIADRRNGLRFRQVAIFDPQTVSCPTVDEVCGSKNSPDETFFLGGIESKAVDLTELEQQVSPIRGLIAEFHHGHRAYRGGLFFNDHTRAKGQVWRER